MLRVCINAFQCSDGLRRAILSVRALLPHAHVTVVDGAYAQFPHDSPQSTDGTLEVAQDLADQVVSRADAWPSEIEKRTAYLLGGEGDQYVVLDADEEVILAPEYVPLGCWDVQFQRKADPAWFPLFRCFPHYPGIRYSETHFVIATDGYGFLNHHPRHLLGLRILHHVGEYDTRRQDARAVYSRELERLERPYRKSREAVAMEYPAPQNDDSARVHVRFNGRTMPEYRGDFRAQKGDVVRITPRAADRLINDWPLDFEIVSGENPAPAHAPPPSAPIPVRKPVAADLTLTAAGSVPESRIVFRHAPVDPGKPVPEAAQPGLEIAPVSDLAESPDVADSEAPTVRHGRPRKRREPRGY